MNNLETILRNTIDPLMRLNCTYAVYADGCLKHSSESFSEALQEISKWSVQIDSAMPSMGTRVSLEVML